MARYPAFLGRSVEVQYRAGDILLPASGKFVADSGRSIFLEQHIEQRGQQKQFRWEIPYQCIVRIKEKEDESAPAAAEATPKVASSADIPQVSSAETEPGNQVSAAAGASGSAPSLLPLQNRPKAV
jgi:hypothetical protein